MIIDVLLDIAGEHSMAFVNLRVDRGALVICKWHDKRAIERRKLDVMWINHRKALPVGRAIGCGTIACLLTDRFDIWLDKAVLMIRVDVFQIMATDLHERVLENLASCDSLIGLLVEQLY